MSCLHTHLLTWNVLRDHQNKSCIVQAQAQTILDKLHGLSSLGTGSLNIVAKEVEASMSQLQQSGRDLAILVAKVSQRAMRAKVAIMPYYKNSKNAMFCLYNHKMQQTGIRGPFIFETMTLYCLQCEAIRALKLKLNHSIWTMWLKSCYQHCWESLGAS